MSLRKLVKFVFARLCMLCSPPHQKALQAEQEELLEFVRSDDATMQAVCCRFLQLSHEAVDRIEREIEMFISRQFQHLKSLGLA